MQVVRRLSKEEKFLVLFKRNIGHSCEYTYTIVSLVVWDAFPKVQCDGLYNTLTDILPKHGAPTVRKCCTNERWGGCSVRVQCEECSVRVQCEECSVRVQCEECGVRVQCEECGVRVQCEECGVRVQFTVGGVSSHDMGSAGCVE